MKNSEQSECHQQGECATTNDMILVCMCECVLRGAVCGGAWGEREMWEKEEGFERML